MRGIDVSNRVSAKDVYPYEEYSVILKSKMHMSYSYRIDRGRIIIELTDYLLDAPDQVLRDLCSAIAGWSRGKRFVLPESFTRYVMTDDFVVRNRPKYIQRSRSITCTQQGRCRDLMDSIERLLDSGLVLPSDIENSYISWASNMARYRFGQCNQMFRVISINPILDSEDVPDHVVDFVVYHEILHLRQDRSKRRRPHNAQFRGWEHQYPGYEKAERFLRNIYSMESLGEDSL